MFSGLCAFVSVCIVSLYVYAICGIRKDVWKGVYLWLFLFQWVTTTSNFFLPCKRKERVVFDVKNKYNPNGFFLKAEFKGW